jgi:hypothetical protein
MKSPPPWSISISICAYRRYRTSNAGYKTSANMAWVAPSRRGGNDGREKIGSQAKAPAPLRVNVGRTLPSANAVAWPFYCSPNTNSACPDVTAILCWPSTANDITFEYISAPV